MSMLMDDGELISISPFSISDQDIESIIDIIPNPHCPCPDCSGDGFLRDGPWGNGVRCKWCLHYSVYADKIHDALFKAQGTVPSESKGADIWSLALLRASIFVKNDWEKDPAVKALSNSNLEELRKEIEELKLRLTSLLPEERESASNRFFTVLSDYSLKSKEKARTLFVKTTEQLKKPFVAFKKALLPYVLRFSYRMRVDRSGIRNGSYQIVIKYEPSSFGKLLKKPEIRQGYYRVENSWEKFPRMRWESSVSESMLNFLEKRYAADRLQKVIDVVEDSFKVRI